MVKFLALKKVLKNGITVNVLDNVCEAWELGKKPNQWQQNISGPAIWQWRVSWVVMQVYLGAMTIVV